MQFANKCKIIKTKISGGELKNRSHKMKSRSETKTHPITQRVILSLNKRLE